PAAAAVAAKSEEVSQQMAWLAEERASTPNTGRHWSAIKRPRGCAAPRCNGGNRDPALAAPHVDGRLRAGFAAVIGDRRRGAGDRHRRDQPHAGARNTPMTAADLRNSP